ncbi:MAG: MarR family transcriptional regulator [Pseudomonadota bacterium]
MSKDHLDRLFTYRLHILTKLADRGTDAAYQDSFGLSLSEGRVLLTVGFFSPVSVKDLAARANLDKSQASRSTEALIKKGLLVKEPNQQDGRGVVISLSGEGAAVYRKGMAIASRRNEELLSVLDDEEKTVFAGALEKVIQQAQRLNETADD